MTRDQLTEEICVALLREGYAIKSLARSCFDVVAKGTEHTLLLRVLTDVNALGQSNADEMKRLARLVGGSPLVIAETAGKHLEDGVVYTRAGLYTMTIATFKQSLKDNLPVVLSGQAGFTMTLSGERLREKREELGLSRSELSRRIGVSPRMVDKYEDDNADVTVTRGMRIYDLLGEDVFSPINPFGPPPLGEGASSSPDPRLLGEISTKYQQLGFDVSEFRKVPFDIIARQEKEIIFTDIAGRARPEMQSISRLVDADNLIIFDDKPPKDTDLPAMKKEEFLEIEKAKELLKFLKEF